MDTIFVADKSLPELQSLFACDIDDSDFYDVIAFHIARQTPQALTGQLDSYQGLRLRGAIFGLGCLRDAKLRPLFESLLGHADPLVAAEAIDALRNSSNQGLWDAVRPHATHNSPFVRGAVLRYARFALPAEEAYPLLLKALQDPDPVVLENAVDELGELGNPDAITHLRPLLQFENEKIREATRSAIAALKSS